MESQTSLYLTGLSLKSHTNQTSNDTKIEGNLFQQTQESQMKFRQNSSSVHSYLWPESTICHDKLVLAMVSASHILFCCCQIKSYYFLSCWVLKMPQLIIGKYPADHYSGMRGIEYKNHKCWTGILWNLSIILSLITLMSYKWLLNWWKL